MATALVAGLLTLTTCARDAVYVPTEQVQAAVQGVPAARYNVPPEAPRGDVTVTSLGVAELEPRNGGPRTKMFHVRAILSNDSDTGAWTFDGRDQRLTMNGATLAPALITSSTQGAPVMTVPAGQKRTVEMYFPPPAGMKPDNVTDFDLLWRVQTPGRTVAERTPFERREIEPQPRYAVSLGLGLGWGPLWWYDPFYYPFVGYAYPPVIHFGVGPYYGYGGYRHRNYAGGFHGPSIAPPAAALPPNRAFRSAPALPPSMPAQPRISAPVPSVPSVPQRSAPAPR